MQIFTPYSNNSAEQAVLGLIISNNDSLSKVSDILKADHFNSESHKLIFAELLKRINLEKSIADFVTLIPFFKTLPEGKDYLVQLTSEATMLCPIREYAFQILELAEKRKLLAGFHDCIVSLETKDVADVVSQVQELIASSNCESGEVEIFDGEGLEQSLIDSWENGSSNIIIPTGIQKLDKMLNGGLTVDKLYTIGAAPGTGKTSMAQQIIVNALKKDLGVLFFSMEMERKNLFVRFLSSFCKINPFRILINNIFKSEQEKFDYALKEWNILKRNYFMTEKGHLSLKKMEATLKRKLRASPIKLVVVDYIQIMELRDSKNLNEAALIKENVRGLKDLATEYHVCVVALSQITKDALGGKPGLKALKGSGGIGEDSDCVINLWADSEDFEPGQVRPINVEVAKNRNGAQGSLVINFDGEFNIFTDNNF